MKLLAKVTSRLSLLKKKVIRHNKECDSKCENTLCSYDPDCKPCTNCPKKFKIKL